MTRDDLIVWFTWMPAFMLGVSAVGGAWLGLIQAPHPHGAILATAGGCLAGFAVGRLKRQFEGRGW